MAMVSEARNHVSAGGARKRALLGIGVGVLVVVVVVIVAALAWSGVTLASDSTRAREGVACSRSAGRSSTSAPSGRAGGRFR